MKRQTSQQLAARRREVVSLTHKGWTQAAIASHWKIPWGTVCRELAAMPRTAAVMRDYAHNCA